MAKKQDEKVGVSESPSAASEETEVTSWLRTIEATLKWRDGLFDRMGLARYINEYKNNWDFLQASVSIPIIPINLVYAYTKTEIARLYFRDPWITVNAKRKEDLLSAQLAEQIINYTWQELKLKQQIKLTLLEALLAGHSWIKVGYAAEFGTVEAQPKTNRGPGRPKKETEVDTNEFIRSESVFAYYVPYKDVIFDPSATFPATHNARWMAHRVVRPLRAVVESGIYENTQLLKPNTYIDDPNVPYDMPDSIKEAFGKDVRSVVLWEIYDLDHQVITTVSPGCPRKLREVPIPEYLNGSFPFVQFAFNPVPGDVYPMSDIAAHEGQILELTKMASIEMNHLKRWNRQMLMREGALTPEEESKFKDANDGAVIKVQGASGEALSQIVDIVPYAPVQADIYGIFNQIYQLWQVISGQSAADQGGQAKTQTRTLGELRMSAQGSKSRAEEKIDALEDSIAEVARKILNIIQKKYDMPKMARIVGPRTIQDKLMQTLPQRPSAQPTLNGQPNPAFDQSQMSNQTFSWNRSDVNGEMDVDVLAGSTVPLDREAQLQIMEKMIPLLPAAGIQSGSPAAKAYAREFMRLIGIQSLEAVMDIAEQTPQQPDPAMMQSQMKAQESQAKIQAKQQETMLKLEGQKAEQAIRIQGMQQQLEIEKQKNQQSLHHQTMQTILQQFRQSQTNGAQNGHKNGTSAPTEGGQ